MKRLLRMLRRVLLAVRGWCAGFVEELREFSASEILDRRVGKQEVKRLLIEHAKDINAATNAPTLEAVWACLDCGRLQGDTTTARCVSCGQPHLSNVSAQLQGIVKVSRFRTKVQR